MLTFDAEERIYDDDDLPVDGREQWELIEDEVGWAVKKKAPLVKEGYLRRKSRLRFGKWKTLYAVLDKEHRYYAYYKKVLEMCYCWRVLTNCAKETRAPRIGDVHRRHLLAHAHRLGDDQLTQPQAVRPP